MFKYIFSGFLDKKTYVPSEHSMQVHVIDPDAKSLSESLGITDGRYEVLHRLVGASIKEIGVVKDGELNVCDVLSEASRHCVHPNELAMVSYMIGATVEKATNPLSFIENLLRP